MRLGERLRALNSIARYLSDLEWVEAESLLGLAGGGSLYFFDWAGATKEQRRAEILRLLSGAKDDTVQGLWELAAPAEAIDRGIRRLPAIEPEPAQFPVIRNPKPAGEIFVVHGHARAILHEAVRVLERGTGREVIVLHEQANAGRTILEKFEAHAASTAFAVVLLTGDDEGGVSRSDARQPRGRQNVIFELGFFFGTLGRQRVAVLMEPGVEKPSDIDGLVYLTIDEAGTWKTKLARELESAGIPVDHRKIP